MIKITKKAALPDLVKRMNKVKAKGLTPEEEYKKLKNPLKAQVIEALMQEQGHLCAYCMRSIPDKRAEEYDEIPGVSIEHWIARNGATAGSSAVGTGLGLDYNNFLAVCSGGVVPRGTYADNETTCDKKRGNTPITVNPLDESTLETIKYTSDGKITAEDETIRKDLQETLNLNCKKYSSLPDGRKAALEPIEKEFFDAISAGEDPVNFCSKILASYTSETDPKTPYVGIIIWWLKDTMAAYAPA